MSDGKERRVTSPTGDTDTTTAFSSARLNGKNRTDGGKGKDSAKAVRGWLWRIKGKHDQALVQARSGQELSTDGGEAQELRGIVG